MDFGHGLAITWLILMINIATGWKIRKTNKVGRVEDSYKDDTSVVPGRCAYTSLLL